MVISRPANPILVAFQVPTPKNRPKNVTGPDLSNMTEHPRLRIAYLCDLDPTESWTYSGGNARILNAVQKHVGDVDIVDRDWGVLEFLRQGLHRSPDAINIRARWRLHILLSRIISRVVTRALARKRYDVLFCSYSFHSMASLRLPYPIVTAFTSDATPTTYKKSAVGATFGSFLFFSRLFDAYVQKSERKVFLATDLNIWPSEWQKDQADRYFNLTDSQSLVVPWGANIEAPARPTDPVVMSDAAPVRLLLVGRDWIAKGGPLAVAVLENLKARGVEATLTVVGSTPPPAQVTAEMTIYPSLDKSIPSEFETFQTLYKDSHFMVMPSYEAYGFAFCEASAYGLPSLCMRAGGVPIRDGINGHALPEGATAKDFVDQILYYRDHPAAYQDLRKSSRQLFESELNWDAWGQRVSDLIRQQLDQRKRA